jgi:hypothetical protein
MTYYPLITPYYPLITPLLHPYYTLLHPYYTVLFIHNLPLETALHKALVEQGDKPGMYITDELLPPFYTLITPYYTLLHPYYTLITPLLHLITLYCSYITWHRRLLCIKHWLNKVTYVQYGNICIFKFLLFLYIYISLVYVVMS